MKPRRSWMIVPAHEPEPILREGAIQPDVVVLDLEYSVPPKHRERARAELGALVTRLADRQLQVFVRIDRETRWADVTAAVARGLKGIVFPGAESAEEVAELDELVGARERASGVPAGETELAIVLESAKGFWNAASIAQASRRVTALGVGRVDLTMQLGPVPQNEFRLYRYLMTRTLVAARMLGKQPLGAMWRPDSRGGVASPQSTARAAREGRLLGFTVCLCATGEQVAADNDGFSFG